MLIVLVSLPVLAIAFYLLRELTKYVRYRNLQDAARGMPSDTRRRKRR